MNLVLVGISVLLVTGGTQATFNATVLDVILADLEATPLKPLCNVVLDTVLATLPLSTQEAFSFDLLNPSKN